MYGREYEPKIHAQMVQIVFKSKTCDVHDKEHFGRPLVSDRMMEIMLKNSESKLAIEGLGAD